MPLDALLDLDRELFLLVNRVQGAAWEIGCGYASWILNGTGVLLLLALGLRAFDRLRFPKNLLIIAAAIGVCSGTNALLKELLGRPRPLWDAELAVSQAPARVRALPGGLEVAEYPIASARWSALAPAVKRIGPLFENQALPSGHTAVSFAAATALIYGFRSRRRYLFLLPAGFVGLSRVACGAHYPIDVAVGAALGAGVAFALLRAFEPFHGLASHPRAAELARLPEERGLRVMMVAGEASADVYGARILDALRALDPDIQAFGIGGERLRRAGLAMEGEAHQLEIVGVTAVLSRLLPLVRLYRRLMRRLREQPPDVLVCIDLPDFNLMLASQARARGIPVLFDISPQFWAWRPGRVEKIAGRISKMIVAFPFEVPFYQRAGVPVAFHGHPLLEGLARRFPNRETALRHFGLDPGRRTLALAPGSRASELAHLVPALFGAAARISQQHPGWQIAVPLAPQVDEAMLQAAAHRAGVKIVCTRGDVFDLLSAADFGILCSGTITLEAALAGLPMVIVYRGNWLNAFLARRLIRIDRIGLPNIVLGGERCVFPELLQKDAAPEPLAARVDQLLRSEPAMAELRAACARVASRLAGGATSRAIAEEVLALAGRAPSPCERAALP
jgi:lipid-A-disaccharide synthase